MLRRGLLTCVRSYSSSAKAAAEFKHVGVVGLGLMGHGIAQTIGIKVTTVESKPEALKAGIDRISGSLSKIVAKDLKAGNLLRILTPLIGSAAKVYFGTFGFAGYCSAVFVSVSP